MQESNNIDDLDSLEPLQEDSSLGSISINNEVVANIVAMAARQVPGVMSLASGGLKEDIAGFFGSKRDGTVSITEDENGSYVIGVKLILTFGVQLAKVAEEVQIAIRDQVHNMTNKNVSRVNVVVDGIRENLPKEESGKDNQD